VTGRSLHDALLRVLTSAGLRRRLARPEDTAADALLGADEAAVLRQADGERLRRLARFMGRHFYRERIVRLFAASRRLARDRGEDLLDVLDGPAFDALLESADVGSTETAERVAALVEARMAPLLTGIPYGRDLLGYEGALFRVEAGPRCWDAGAAGGEAPVRSARARVCVFEWDVTGLVTAVRRGDARLPDPSPGSTRLLVALSPAGRVTTVRCPELVERLLAALDGARTADELARGLGLAEPDVARALRQLTEVGAVEWRPRSPER
jgi:hypothetical protein